MKRRRRRPARLVIHVHQAAPLPTWGGVVRQVLVLLAGWLG